MACWVGRSVVWECVVGGGGVSEEGGGGLAGGRGQREWRELNPQTINHIRQ